MLEWRKSRTWRVIRFVWVGLGLTLLAYLLLSFSAWGVDPRTLESDERVEVSIDPRVISFTPRGGESGAGVVFVPGGLVSPEAYAPLLRGIADAGYPAVLVKLPSLGGRHAMGAEGRAEAARRVLSVLETRPGESPWVIAGHSLGGLIAAMAAAQEPARMSSLVLIGTTHPRDFSLSSLRVPVFKVFGTRDGIAPLDRAKANEANLPVSTEWIAIEGGNHSQFGYYGFQLGDRTAEISREDQQGQTLAILLRAISSGAHSPLP
jgi:pimeloyl-ACP methyl ester carboxylesterase